MSRIVREFNFKAVDLVNELTTVDTQDPLVQGLVNYAVATQGESFFKKQREIAKEQLIKSIELSPDLHQSFTKVIEDTKSLDQGQSSIIANVDGYQLIISTKRGASRLNAKALRNALVKKFPAKDVDEALLEATTQSAPSVSYIVTEDDA